MGNPFLLGLLVIIPIHQYLAYAGKLEVTQKSYFSMVFSWFDLKILFSYKTLFYLWFLRDLLMISVFFVIFLSFYNRILGKLRIFNFKKNSDIFDVFLIFLPVLILIAISILLIILASYTRSGDFNGLYFPLTYSLFYVTGYIFGHSKHEEYFPRYAKMAVVILMWVYSILLLALLSNINWISVSLAKFISVLTRGALGWLWILVFLGVSKLGFDRPNSFINKMNQLGIAIYVLHHLVIMLIGFVTVRLPLGLYEKYLLVLCSSLVITWIIADKIVLGNSAMRFVLGVKEKKN